MYFIEMMNFQEEIHEAQGILVFLVSSLFKQQTERMTLLASEACSVHITSNCATQVPPLCLPISTK